MTAQHRFSSIGAFATLLLTSTLLSTVASSIISRRYAVEDQNKAKVFSALRVADALERYATTLQDYRSNIPTYEQARSGFNVPPIPVMPEYPTDIDWKLLDVQTSSAAFSVQNLSRSAAEGVRGVYKKSNTAAISRAFVRLLRDKALLIAARVRKEYGLPVAVPRSDGVVLEEVDFTSEMRVLNRELSAWLEKEKRAR